MADSLGHGPLCCTFVCLFSGDGGPSTRSSHYPSQHVSCITFVSHDLDSSIRSTPFHFVPLPLPFRTLPGLRSHRPRLRASLLLTPVSPHLTLRCHVPTDPVIFLKSRRTQFMSRLTSRKRIVEVPDLVSNSPTARLLSDPTQPHPIG